MAMKKNEKREFTHVYSIEVDGEKYILRSWHHPRVFKHMAEIIKLSPKGSPASLSAPSEEFLTQGEVRWCNRTWERFPYESSLKVAIGALEDMAYGEMEKKVRGMCFHKRIPSKKALEEFMFRLTHSLIIPSVEEMLDIKKERKWLKVAREFSLLIEKEYSL